MRRRRWEEVERGKGGGCKQQEISTLAFTLSLFSIPSLHHYLPLPLLQEDHAVTGQRSKQQQAGISAQLSLCTKIYTSHIKLSTVYMYPHISSWRHSEKRADSNQARAYKVKRRGIKLTWETALAREKRIFHFPHLVSPASLLQNRHSYLNFALFILCGNEVTKTLVHTTSWHRLAYTLLFETPSLVAT